MDKRKKFFAVLGAVIAVVAIVFIVRFVFSGNEDEWICENGKWQAHGKPLDPMPPAFICE